MRTERVPSLQLRRAPGLGWGRRVFWANGHYFKKFFRDTATDSGNLSISERHPSGGANNVITLHIHAHLLTNFHSKPAHP